MIDQIKTPIDLFMDLRVGLFLHWNPVALVGQEISWSRDSDRKELVNHPRSYIGPLIPAELYDSMYRYFDPTAFSAIDIVSLAKSCGFRYVYIVAKHHDGFCNFDSDETDYKITSKECPFKRDIVKEIADACHTCELGFGIYYSQPDWHHPDYRTDRHNDYIRYLHSQVEELCTRYGRIDAWWFDGLAGDNPMLGVDPPPAYREGFRFDHWDSVGLIAKMREWQPNMVINDRCVLPGDFKTAEQRVGAYDALEPWESTITLGDQWSYSFRERVKPAEECIGHIVSSAFGGGNFVLNVGPDALGEIAPNQVAVMRTIGDWLANYGESIYGTRAGPYPSWTWGGSTHRGTTVYLHVRNWPERRDELILPLGGARLVEVELLTCGLLQHEVRGEDLVLTLDKHHRDPVDNIVRVQFDVLPNVE